MSIPPYLVQTIPAVDNDEAYSTTLEAVLDRGLSVQGGISESTASGKVSNECLNFAVVVQEPRQRLLRNPARTLNLPAAVARFVWMMAGSDRLADIAFYEPKVRLFTDDGISVPGSNYGQRILQPRPGLNQLLAVVKRLQEDPHTRRAAISIYHPEDAVRSSKDVPCAFGVFYHVREGRLHSTTVMRSNNAYILLPYNLFEFSLLAEVVAVEIGAALGPLTHFAASMHVFAENVGGSREIIAAHKLGLPTPLPMPVMPATPSPVDEVRKLVVLEADLRHGSAALGEGNIEDWIERGVTRLSSYWRQLYFLLAIHIARANKSRGALERLEAVIETPWKEALPADTFTIGHQTAATAELAALELGLEPQKIVPITSTRAHRELRSAAVRWQTRHGTLLTWEKFVALEDLLGDRLAARGDTGITDAEFDSMVDGIRPD